MKKKITMLAIMLATSTIIFTSCSEYGENSETPPESTTGNTQETGVEGTGDLPGTAADDTSEYVNSVIGDDNAAEGDSLE